MLTIIATPIGNLKDVTIRSLEIMEGSDAIICEDTRRSGIFLNHYNLHKPLIVLNDFNESKTIPSLLERLKNGENLVLISDAGTPLISDPGYKLIRSCIEQNIAVDSLPGPSAPIDALVLSGLPPDKFMFLGFLPDKSGHRQNVLQQIKLISQISPVTFILFVAPFKLIKTLGEIEENFGNIPVTLAKELTKIHQAVTTYPLSQWQEKFKKSAPRGEYVLLIRP